MKKPDNVAESPGLLPYGTNVSAPAIKIEDTTSWKLANSAKVNHQQLKHLYQTNLDSNKKFITLYL